jgi:DNA ligase (NAD+)
MEKKVLERVRHLNALVMRHRKAYELGKPTITDTEYDAIYCRLKELVFGWNVPLKYAEALNHPGVHLPVGKGTKEHLTPMLSLKTFFDVEAACKFMKKVSNTWVVQPKLDGVSLSLIYHKGVLVDALLRGDGVRGESVLNNVRNYVHSFPRKINKTALTEIRGEVIFTHREFKKNTGYKSARNAVAGILRRKERTKLNGLPDFIAWGFGQHYCGRNEYIDTVQTEMTRLEDWGFLTVPSRIVTSPSTPSFYDAPGLRGPFQFPYEQDGVVLKAHWIKDRKVGASSHHPYWACAVKIEKYDAIGRIDKVHWQVGRTGAITPVAELEKPVRILGADITYVTLHNVNHMHELGVKINSRVKVERRGGVIPKITSVVNDPRKVLSRKIKIPTACPECKTKLRAHRCPNDHCSGRLKAWIQYAAKLLDLDGIGEGVATRLVDSGYVEEPIHLFQMRVWELEHMEIVVGKNAQKIVAQMPKEISFPLLLQLLDIEGLGPEMAVAIAKVYKTPENMCTQNWVPMVKSNAVRRVSKNLGLVKPSENVARVLDMLHTKKIYKRVDLFLSSVTVPSYGKQSKGNGKLCGYSFMFTGTLTEPRRVFKERVQNEGGVFKTSVSKDLNYLVTGSTPTGHKVKKAKELGTKVITEKQFRRML